LRQAVIRILRYFIASVCSEQSNGLEELLAELAMTETLEMVIGLAGQGYVTKICKECFLSG